ncbi:MAG TPA: hypothetical protein VGM87_16680 [Roseomonas sp.]|jgi:hypothetical protein
MLRVALPLLLLAGCSFSNPPSPVTATTSNDAPTIEAACRREAERAVLYRDRGQQMRLDEGENQAGGLGSVTAVRARSDAAGQIVERDRLARECVQASRAAATPAPATQPVPAPSPRRAR